MHDKKTCLYYIHASLINKKNCDNDDVSFAGRCGPEKNWAGAGRIRV